MESKYENIYYQSKTVRWICVL